MPLEKRSHHRHHSGPLRRPGPISETTRHTPFRSDAELSLAFHRHHRTLVRQVQELKKLVDELKEECDHAVRNHKRIAGQPRHSEAKPFGTIITRILQHKD